MQPISYTYSPKGKVLGKFLKKLHIKHMDIENFNQNDINSFYKIDDEYVHTEAIYYLNSESDILDFIHIYQVDSKSKINEFIIKPINKLKITL